VIRGAQAEDLPLLPKVEVAAGAVFRDLGMHAVANSTPPTLGELQTWQEADGLLVSVDGDDLPVAYLKIGPIDDYGHIEQVSVHPSHARRGIGRRLIDAADGWAEQRDLAGLTLTTFTEVPWNGPYYQRLGFRVLADEEMTDGLRRIRADEAACGLDRWPRVAMLRPLR
jgi:GNAT superfamily N-acetyltransferase